MRLTNRKTYSDLKNNAERLQAKGMEVSISDLMYIKLAEYENAQEDSEKLCENMQTLIDDRDPERAHKEEYLKDLNKLLDSISAVSNKVNNLPDFTNLLRLQFDIITAAYNCSKEDNNGSIQRILADL